MTAMRVNRVKNGGRKKKKKLLYHSKVAGRPEGLIAGRNPAKDRRCKGSSNSSTPTPKTPPSRLYSPHVLCSPSRTAGEVEEEEGKGEEETPMRHHGDARRWHHAQLGLSSCTVVARAEIGKRKQSREVLSGF